MAAVLQTQVDFLREVCHVAVAAVLETQVDFLKEVCHVPHLTFFAKGWAQWRNDSGWTILHCMAEHLNNQCLPLGWLNAMQVEDFIGIFRQRSGIVDAVIEKGPGQGYKALHTVAHRVREVMGGARRTMRTSSDSRRR